MPQRGSKTLLEPTVTDFQTIQAQTTGPERNFMESSDRKQS